MRIGKNKLLFCTDCQKVEAGIKGRIIIIEPNGAIFSKDYDKFSDAVTDYKELEGEKIESKEGSILKNTLHILVAYPFTELRTRIYAD